MITTQYEKFDVDHMPITIEFPTLEEAKLDAARIMKFMDLRYVRILQDDVLLWSAIRYIRQGELFVMDFLAQAAHEESAKRQLNQMYGKFNDPPWYPMTSQIDLKHIGKLGEECGELSSAISRCIIQGIDEKDPGTGKPNRLWLQEEIADVLANIQLVRRHFDLNDNEIHERIIRKVDGLMRWHGELK